jgi:hypothetical protein
MGATTRCPGCQGTENRTFLEIRSVPVEGNLLLDSEAEARAVPRGDIELALCGRCGLIWNTRFDPSLLRYNSRYENSLWSSPHFAAYGRELAQRLIDRYGIRRKTVVEIGAGQGEFLSLLCRLGNNRGIGIDPAYDPNESRPPENVRMVAEEFSDRHPLAADLVVCRHVLEHLADPAGFLGMVRRAIDGRESTVVYLEVPDSMFVFRDNSIWDIIYEHCSYFTNPALDRLLRATGFDVKELYSMFGGQFLALESFPQPTEEQPPPDLRELEVTIRAFHNNYYAVFENWAWRLADWKRRGLHVALWGAGSKGVTFLNTVPGARGIETVVDINRRKQRHHVAGTGQPVLSPERLRSRRPEVVLVMNPIYRAEIRQMLLGLGVAADVVSIIPQAA